MAFLSFFLMCCFLLLPLLLAFGYLLCFEIRSCIQCLCECVRDDLYFFPLFLVLADFCIIFRTRNSRRYRTQLLFVLIRGIINLLSLALLKNKNSKNPVWLTRKLCEYLDVKSLKPEKNETFPLPMNSLTNMTNCCFNCSTFVFIAFVCRKIYIVFALSPMITDLPLKRC